MTNKVLVIGLLLSTGFLICCTEDNVGPKVDCSVEGPALELTEIILATCGESDGGFTVLASGGDGAFQFALSNGVMQDNGSFNNLPAGNYVVTVTDGNKCEVSMSVTVTNPNGVVISQVVTGPSGCGSTNGTVQITAEQGAPPYEYRIGSGGYKSENSFSGLSSGSHLVAVRDSEGCEFMEHVEILSGVSLQNQIEPIISSNCAVSGCHNGSQSPNLTTPGSIISNAGRIKSLTQSGVMPKRGSLTQEEIDLIACWVDDGAKDN